MGTLASRPSLRRALGALALAPLTSLVVSRLLADAIGAAGLDASLPVGVHTYVPGVDLVDVRWLALIGLLLAAPGLVLVRSARGGRAGLQVGGFLVAAQVLLYVAQAVLVAQVRGLPDATPAVVLALTLQSALTLVLVAGVSIARAALAILVHAIALPVTRAPGAVPRRRIVAGAGRGIDLRSAPPRGPPKLPIVDRC